jgi:glycerophosphoryl diester phosphodiesterase
VVFHDDDLERETGVKGTIEDYDLSNLRKLRLEGTDEVIPTFDEVLDLYEDTGLALLIELKVNRGNYRELSRAVAKRLDSYKGPFAVQSFDPRVLVEFKKIRPDVVRGQLAKDFRKSTEGLPFYQIPFLTNMALNRLTKPDFISYKFKDRDNRSLRRRVDKGGMTEASWTIRSAKALKDAVKAGCIPIFEKIEPEDLKEILGVEERKKVK